MVFKGWALVFQRLTGQPLKHRVAQKNDGAG